jgi:hypothetical protein
MIVVTKQKGNGTTGLRKEQVVEEEGKLTKSIPYSTIAGSQPHIEREMQGR